MRPRASWASVVEVIISHVVFWFLLVPTRGSPVFNLSRGCLAGQELKMSSHAGFPAPRAAWPDVGRDNSVSPPRGTSLVVKAGRPAGSASLHVDAFVSCVRVAPICLGLPSVECRSLLLRWQLRAGLRARNEPTICHRFFHPPSPPLDWSKQSVYTII